MEQTTLPAASVASAEADPRVGTTRVPARPIRLAILLGRPVQYFVPVFRELAQRPEIDLTVIYCSLGGAHAYFDREFGRDVQWDTPLLDGYRYRVLRAWWPRKIEGPLGNFAPGIVRELKAENYDALIVFGWAHLTCWLAFAEARRQSIPWMLYGDTNVIYEKGKRGLRRLVRNSVLHALFRRTSAFLISSSFNGRFYDAHGAGRERFRVPHVADVRFFSVEAGRARARRDAIRLRYGIAPDAVLVLFVGKLVTRKRPLDLLAALERLQDSHPKVGVAFVGEGPLSNSLRAAVKRKKLDNVFVLGFVNQSQMPALYAMSDVLALPSDDEPIGVVAHEAAACGLPLIVSNRTGLWGPGDVVRHAENGFVYPAGDVPALTEAVRCLAADAELRGRMGKRSREIVQDFTPERCAESIAHAALETCRTCTTARWRTSAT